VKNKNKNTKKFNPKPLVLAIPCFLLRAWVKTRKNLRALDASTRAPPTLNPET
jgi:hypothetical protein